MIPLDAALIVGAEVSAGDFHSLARLVDGTVWAWGNNTYGQIGNGTVIDQYVPVLVPGLEDLTGVDAGGTAAWPSTRSAPAES